MPGKDAPENGLVEYPTLSPGRYKLEITREDYEPITATVDIKRGKSLAVSGPLLPKYGTIILSLGVQAMTGAPVELKLNGEEIKRERLKTEEGRIYVSRVPVGLQKISVSKNGYADWSQERVILRGECGNLVTVTMAREAIALTVKSLPNAIVYIDNMNKGRIKADGTLLIPDLDPGEYELGVELDGYETVKLPLKLPLDERKPVKEVALVPIADDIEFEDKFNPDIRNWTPERPLDWKLNTDIPVGRHIKG
ncbi:MAG: PEGA domain-containing protein, partial [Candidatus Methylomirabilis sp.]